MADTIVETHNLSKTYIRDVIGTEHGRMKIRLKNRRVDALKSLDLKVKEGQIFGLLGPNGAGKTTAIKILMGLIFPTAGSARLMGMPLGDKSVKAKIGFLPENPYFYDYLKGYEFLDYYGQLYGMDRSTRRKKIPELLELVSLNRAADLPLKGYSKGMLQRIGLAQALLNDPKVVFLDEPQSGLDPLGRKEVRDIILSLKDRGATVFFSSHILSDAEMICDRVAILVGGELVEVGAMDDLLSARVNSYEIEAQDIPAEMVSRLEKMSRKVIKSKKIFLFVVDEEKKAEQIVKQITETSGRLISFIPRRETLEEYFIRRIKAPRREEDFRNTNVAGKKEPEDTENNQKKS